MCPIRILPLVATLFFLCSPLGAMEQERIGPDQSLCVVQSGNDVHDDVARAFERAVQSAAKSLSGELGLLGSDAIPVLLEIVVSESVPTIEGGSRILAPAEERDILSTLGKYPMPLLRGPLGALASPSASEHARLFGLSLLQRVGAATEMDLVVDLAKVPDTPILSRTIRSRFESALRGILARHEWTAGDIVFAFQRAHPSLHFPIMRVVKKMGGVQAARALSECLGLSEESDATLLIALAQLGDNLPQPVHPSILSNVRSNLNSKDIHLLLAAIDCTVRLGDVEAVGRLIVLLQHPMGNVQQKALAALEGITGQHFGTNAGHWDAWYKDELSWWRREAPDALAVLQNGSPAAVADSLMALSRRRLFRHQISLACTDVLYQEESELIVLACATIGTLGSWNPAPDLVELLGHQDLAVRAAAAKALKQITGQEFAQNQKLWSAWLKQTLGADT